MISKRANVVRKLLKSFASKKDYRDSPIEVHRKKFDRNLRLLFPTTQTSKYERKVVAGVDTVWFYPPVKTERTIMYIHGGGFVVGSPLTHAQHTARLSKICKATVVSVDYSLAPESTFPTALNELLRVWQELLASGIDPNKAAFMGDSAGGNLALALSLKVRDEKLAQPACTVLLSPALDANFSGASYEANAKKDPMLTIEKMRYFLDSYIGEASREDPLLSPVSADLRGLPPMLIQVGTEEIVLSDSEIIAEHAIRDNVTLTLDIDEGMWHGYHFFAAYVPEAKQALQRVAKFLDERIKS